MLYLPKLKHEGNGQTIRLLRPVSVEQLLVLVRGPQIGLGHGVPVDTSNIDREFQIMDSWSLYGVRRSGLT
jgi:hypothetical protein